MLWGRVTYEMMEAYWSAVARGDEGIRPVSHESEDSPPTDLAAYTRALRMLYLDASAELRAQDASQPPLVVETADDHDLYAALQAEFIVANVPGVLSSPMTGAPGALPAAGAPQPLSDAAARSVQPNP